MNFYVEDFCFNLNKIIHTEIVMIAKERNTNKEDRKKTKPQTGLIVVHRQTVANLNFS